MWAVAAAIVVAPSLVLAASAAAAAPTLTTQASSPASLGSPMFDAANLSGGSNPTGTITFALFGPDNPACAGPPAFTSTNPVFPGPAPTTSGSFVPVTPGTYRWVASYSGDANNSPVGPTACGDPTETVVVPPPPSLSLTTRAFVPFPGSPGLFDSASLSGGLNPTGTVTFTLFGPDDPTCAGVPVFTSTSAVFPNGLAQSDTFTPIVAGTYRWVAIYSGDANNAAVGPTACGDPDETVSSLPPPIPQGFLTICKAKKNGAVGDYTFTISDQGDQTVTVGAGQCSAALPVPAGVATVTETPTVGFRLANCATTPASRLLACQRHAGSATVQVPGGGQTVVTLTNRRASGTLKICKVAGAGVAPGSPHVFKVNGQRVVVKAGPAPGGGCALAGSFPVGTQVTVVERMATTERVSAIAVRPNQRLVGTPDLPGGTVTVSIDKGVTEITYTNERRDVR